MDEEEFDMYLCEICKKKPATVHLTNIENNVKKELHMCENCASNKGFNLQQAIHLPNFMLNPTDKTEEKQQKEEELHCDACGMMWSEFRDNGRFGCAHDYDAFRPRLEQMLSDIHARGKRHVGKTPVGKGGDAELRREVLECRRKLREAIETERYEDAAQLRDRLAELEKKD